MIALNQWAQRHGITPQALAELSDMLGFGAQMATELIGQSEGAAQQRVRAEAPRHGVRLYRNNRGGFQNESGQWVRFGLANDTPAMDKVLKSSDLIGITPHTIQPMDIGSTVGIFTSIEMKKPGWVFKGTPRETAQQAWNNLIISMGGKAQFATGPDNVRW